LEWESLQLFLLDAVFGVVLLGTLGRLVGILALKFIGRVNSQIKRLGLFYRRGKEELKLELVNAPTKLKKAIFMIQIRTVIGCMLTLFYLLFITMN